MTFFVEKKPLDTQGLVNCEPLGSGVGSGGRFDRFGGHATTFEVLACSTGLGVGFHHAQQASGTVGHDDVVHTQHVRLVHEFVHVAVLHVDGLEGPGANFFDGAGRGHNDVTTGGLEQHVTILVGGDIGAIQDGAINLRILQDLFLFA